MAVALGVYVKIFCVKMNFDSHVLILFHVGDNALHLDLSLGFVFPNG